MRVSTRPLKRRLLRRGSLGSWMQVKLDVPGLESFVAGNGVDRLE
jgi:hypothetical protein